MEKILSVGGESHARNARTCFRGKGNFMNSQFKLDGLACWLTKSIISQFSSIEEAGGALQPGKSRDKLITSSSTLK